MKFKNVFARTAGNRPAVVRDVLYALAASLALWAVIFAYLANHQGLQVFRYVRF